MIGREPYKSTMWWEYTLVILTLILAALVLFSPYVEADFYGKIDSKGDFRFVNVPSENIRVANRKQLNRPFEKTLQQAADRFALDPNFLAAVMRSESNFRPNVVSRKGARGLMQLMPRTARVLGVRNINNPVENVNGGARYLRWLLNRYKGNRELTAAAYNAGISSVKRYGGVPPYKETEKYVDKVLAYYRGYRRQ